MSKVKGGARKPTRREVNLAATRKEALEAARRLFLKAGYAGTTLQAVAAEAGMAVQTLYNAVGNKAALLTGVFEATVSGPQAPLTVPELMRARNAQAEGAQGCVDVLVDWFVEVHERMAPLWKVIDDAAGHDEAVSTFARERAHRRLRNYQQAAQELKARGALHPGQGLEEAAAVIWSLGHPNVYRALVLEGGWSPGRYRAWLSSSLGAALLPPARARTRK